MDGLRQMKNDEKLLSSGKVNLKNNSIQVFPHDMGGRLYPRIGYLQHIGISTQQSTSSVL